MLWGKKARKRDRKLPGRLGKGVACNVHGVQSPKVPFKQRPKEGTTQLCGGNSKTLRFETPWRVPEAASCVAADSGVGSRAGGEGPGPQGLPGGWLVPGTGSSEQKTDVLPKGTSGWHADDRHGVGPGGSRQTQEMG